MEWNGGGESGHREKSSGAVEMVQVRGYVVQVREEDVKMDGLSRRSELMSV